MSDIDLNLFKNRGHARPLLQFRVSLDALKDLLHLPEGVTILAVSGDAIQQEVAREITVVAQVPDMPEAWHTSYGDAIPTATPSFVRDEKGEIHFRKWGIEDAAWEEPESHEGHE